MRLFPVIAAVVAVLMLLACAETPAPVPKPRAYPRLACYACEPVAVETGDVGFMVNSAAEVSYPRNGWIDIAYPRYAATVHITVSRLENDSELRMAVENRAERIGLNLAGRRSETGQFTNDAGFGCSLTRALEPSPVPYQFIAVGPDRLFVSGAVAMNGSVEPVDSVAPVLRALYSDISVILDSLSCRR